MISVVDVISTPDLRCGSSRGPFQSRRHAIVSATDAMEIGRELR